MNSSWFRGNFYEDNICQTKENFCNGKGTIFKKMSLTSSKHFLFRHLRHYLKCIYVKNMKENKFFEEVSNKQFIPLLTNYWRFKYHSESYSDPPLKTFWSKNKVFYWGKILTGNSFLRGNTFLRNHHFTPMKFFTIRYLHEKS